MAAPQALPRDVAIMHRLTSTVRGLPGIRGAAYSQPQDFARPIAELPFANIWDFRESFDLEQGNDHYFNETNVSVDVTYRYDDDVPGETLLEVGKRLRSQLLLVLVPRLNLDWCLEGLGATDLIPTECTYSQVVDESDREGLGIMMLTLTLRYNCAAGDLYATAA